MSKIVFIEPKPPNFHIFSKFMSPRLGTFILGNLMKQRGWEVEIYVEDMGQVDWDRVPSADIVGISSITSTAPRAYKIADKIREMGIPVIMGGAHPTFLTKEALGHADFVIRGEGEHPVIFQRSLPCRIKKMETWSIIPRWKSRRIWTTFHSLIFPCIKAKVKS
jgi:hypothetical protein